MKRRLVVLPEAELELAEAAIWYEAHRPGLAVEFVAAIDDALSAIVLAPEACPTWPDDPRFRKRLVDRFPYIVFFTSSSDAVRIAAFAHAKRKPGYWTRRVPDRP